MKKTKYNVDINFFKNPINWEQKHAYFLGWLTSDGSNQKNGAVRIALQEKDKKILEILKNQIQYNGPLYYMKRNGVNSLIGNSKWQNRWSLTIGRREMSNDLLDLGIDNNKSNNLKFPDFLKNDLISHYLRSYYEGDGTISYSFDRSRGQNRLMFEIHLVGTVPFLNKVNEILKTKINVECRTIDDGKMQNGNRILKFSGNYAALKFFNYIYNDAEFLLKRKFRKFIRLINYMKRIKHEEFKEEKEIEIKKAIILAKWLVKNAQY